MAQAVTPEPETESTEPVAPPDPSARRRLRPPRPRLGGFRRVPLKPGRVTLAYGLLVLALGGAITGIVLASTGSDSTTKAPAASRVPSSSDWSKWQPTGVGSTAVREIAAHVSHEYRLPNGKQLLNVVAHKPALANGLDTFAVSTIAIQSDTGGRDSDVFPVGSGVMYILCGTAQDCSIGSGKPSAARGTLVRREALELALYTFKYVDGIDTVLAYVPSAPGSTDKQFIVLRRGEIERYLDRPLANTLGPEQQVKPGDVDSKETGAIDGIAIPHLFILNQTQQLPDQTLALLLTPESLPSL